MNHRKAPGFNDKQNIENELLQEVLKGCSKAALLLNNEGRIVFCSENINEIGGYHADEIVDKLTFDFLLPIDGPITKQHLEDLLQEKGTSASALLQAKHKDGSIIWLDVTVKDLSHPDFIESILVFIKRSDDCKEVDNNVAVAIAHAKEEERKHLATELHDNVNQIIAASKLLVDTALMTRKKNILLRQCSDHLQMANEEIRRLSYSMASYDLDKYGLLQAVTLLTDTFKMAREIDFSINIDPCSENLLTSDQRLHVYRIIQEALNNSLKHAEASKVLIGITRKENIVQLVIKDNGKGFSLRKRKASIGLSSMSNRARLLTGHFFIKAPKGRGTTIEIHFPGGIR